MASSQDEQWSSVFDPKLAGLLSELELGLGSVVRQTGAQPAKGRGTSEDDVLGKKERKDRRKNGRRSSYSTFKNIYIYIIYYQI